MFIFEKIKNIFYFFYEYKNIFLNNLFINNHILFIVFIKTIS